MSDKSPKPPEPFARPLKLRLAYAGYQVLIHFLLPVYLAVLFWRSRKEPLYRKNLRDRFGFWPQSDARPVWIFAASLGETRAISPVVRQLLDSGYQVALTHTSPAGVTAARRLFHDDIARSKLRTGYVPLDLFWCLQIFLRRVRPQIGIVVEMELWPGLMIEAFRRRVPMIKANGNYIQKSMERDQKGFGLRLLLLQGFSRVLTKSETRVATYEQAGVNKDRIRLVGELKFDQAVEPVQEQRAEQARSKMPSDRKVFMIASSVEDEEIQLVQLVEALRANPDAPLIIWVPRSPQRFGEIVIALSSKGIRVALRSVCFDEDLCGEIPGDTDVLVGDSLGEMTFYYGLSDLVFVGASLVEHGGHNIIEPLAQGKPVLMGSSYYSVAFPADDARRAGAFESLPDAGAIAARVIELLRAPEKLEQMSKNASGFNVSHTGAAARSIAEMSPYLTGPDSRS